MNEGVASPGSLSVQGGLIRAGMKVRKENGRIVLSQTTRFWVYAAVSFWALIVLAGPFMIYSDFFGSQTTHFTCDRGTGVCAVDGRSKDSPPMADIKRAEIDRDFNRRDGANYGITLVARDGKKYRIEQQRAIKSSVVAEYRAAVKTINAYLADPAQQKFDVSFTYSAGWWEKIQSVFYFLVALVFLCVGLMMWSKRRYILEREKITFLIRGPFQRYNQELPTARISAIVDHMVANQRRIDLKVDAYNGIGLVSASAWAASKLDQIALDLAEFLEKPIEKANG
jgi:hypothetical protein